MWWAATGSVVGGVVTRGARRKNREQKAAVHQLDVAEPGQEVREHDLPPVGVSGGKPLANLCKKKEGMNEAMAALPLLSSWISLELLCIKK